MRGLSEFEIEKQQGYRLVGIQIAFALMFVVPVYLYTYSWNMASAVLWGAITAALNGWSLVRGLEKIKKNPNYQPHHVLRGVIRNSVERFFVVVMSLSLAMGGLKLPAAAVLLGFVVGLVVPIVARILMIKR